MSMGVYDRTKAKVNSGQFSKGSVPWNKGKDLPRGKDNPNYKGDNHILVAVRGGSRYGGAKLVRYVRDETGRLRQEHRIIAERALGRKLKKEEQIHHIDMNPLNNNKFNLLICLGNFHKFLEQRYAKRFAELHLTRKDVIYAS